MVVTKGEWPWLGRGRPFPRLCGVRVLTSRVLRGLCDGPGRLRGEQELLVLPVLVLLHLGPRR